MNTKHPEHLPELQPTEAQTERLLSILSFTVLGGFVFLLSTIKIFEDDVFWHLATGRWIVEHRTVPATDVFGFLTSGQPWIPFEWGWDVVTYALYSLTGDYTALQFVNSILWVAVFLISALTLRKLRVPLPVILFLLAVACCASYGRMSPRPQVISLLALSAISSILYSFSLSKEKNIKLLYILPVIIGVWANMHPGFLSGLLAIGLFTLSNILQRAFRKPAQSNKDRNASTGLLIIITLSSCVVSLFTPHGMQAIGYIVSHTNMSILSGIEEWTPPFELETTSGILVMYALMLALGSISILYSWKTKNPFPALLYLAFAALSLKAVRFTADFAVVSSVGTGLSIAYMLNTPRLKKLLHNSYAIYGATGLLIVMILMIPSGAFSSAVGVNLPFGYGIDETAFPLPLFNFMKEHSIHGKPFNDFGIGGLLIWEFPEEKNFIDSRNLNDNISNAYLSILNREPGFDKAIDRYGIDYMIFHVRDLRQSAENMKYSPIPFCATNRDTWKLVFWDDNSFLYVRNIPKFRQVIADFEYTIVDPYLFVFSPEMFDSLAKANIPQFRRELTRKLKEEPKGSVISFIAKQTGIF